MTPVPPVGEHVAPLVGPVFDHGAHEGVLVSEAVEELRVARPVTDPLPAELAPAVIDEHEQG